MVLVSIHIEECHGLKRDREPIRIGVPFPRGMVNDTNSLVLKSNKEDTLPLQSRTLAYWPDRSVKWALVDFNVAASPWERQQHHIRVESSDTNSAVRGVAVIDSPTSIRIDTGNAVFRLPKTSNVLIDSVVIGDYEMLAGRHCWLSLIDDKGRSLMVEKKRIVIEESGPLRCVIKADGVFGTRFRKNKCNFTCRLNFFAESTQIIADVQLHNPKAALHPGGIWDLGDPNSFYFKLFSLNVETSSDRNTSAEVTLFENEPTNIEKNGQVDHNYPNSQHVVQSSPESKKMTIYQDSSGGDNWRSTNHVDKNGTLTVQFRGYQITENNVEGETRIEEGLRAEPVIRILDDNKWIAAGVENFWQNFPTALTARPNGLEIGIFPAECTAGYELQGGEKKRHRIFLEFGGNGEPSSVQALLHPLHVYVDPQWTESCGVVPYLTRPSEDADDIGIQYVRNIIEGPHSFFNKREKIDEYGWRNFGDLYADHEAVNHKYSDLFVSHYNNQYDFVFGALSHFLISGDRRWRSLMEDAARHLIDIDIYHTDDDKSAYNHGLFWHTDHHKNASTCTHRTYSKINGPRGKYGGGPSNEHNYTCGLLYYYYVTGDVEARNAVLELAGWVMAMDDGSLTLLGLIDEGPTGHASATVSQSFHKPGRGAGNSINALLDAYQLNGDRRFILKAEALIQRCIHPSDDIYALELDEPEYRWSYLVFLQVLGKYLNTKEELGELDYGFYYARDSLLHYADWMLINEVPYKDVLHKVLIPTETWPAQDIRKCHVFHLAEKHGTEEIKKKFLTKAVFFYECCMNDLLNFDTAFLTRPLVILAVYGYVHAYYERTKNNINFYKTHGYIFGNPQQFKNQKERLNATFLNKIKLILKGFLRSINVAKCKIVNSFSK